LTRRRNGGDEEAEADAAAPEATGLAGVDAAPMAPLSREEIEALRAERDDLRDQLLRRRAEFENFKKRVERDRHLAGVDATALLLKALVPTLDNLDRALAAPGGEGLREGVELIRRDLLALLESHGVGRLDPKGERFDPEQHQALAHEAAPGHREGTVTEVFGKGYTFKDRLLRPALVKVAKGAIH
jgi:molecular chaperone GrpE